MTSGMWLHICSKCGNEVRQEDAVVTSPCPGCQGTSWLSYKLAGGDRGGPGDNFVTPAQATEWQNKRYEILGKGFTLPAMPRGRRPMGLPMGKIKKLHKEGLGVRAIARRLRFIA